MKRQDSILLLTGAVIRIRMKFPYRLTPKQEKRGGGLLATIVMSNPLKRSRNADLRPDEIMPEPLYYSISSDQRCGPGGNAPLWLE